MFIYVSFGELDPSPEDIAGRVNMREGFRVCSIDPPGYSSPLSIYRESEREMPIYVYK